MAKCVYRNNPLIEVIIQFRFPKLLTLVSNDPIDFQESIRDEFPYYQLTIENQQEISLSVNDNNPVASINQRALEKNHSFVSSDGQYKINLTSSFISISTVNYTKWEDMKGRFSKPLEAFESIYKPQFYERIGLRYIDAYSRAKLHLEGTMWRDLIESNWLGPLALIDESKVVLAGNDIEYIMDDGISRAKIHCGLGSLNDNPETVFIIDSDFIHISTIGLSKKSVVLEYLHDNAKKFIESAITKKLHEAMIPEYE